MNKRCLAVMAAGWVLASAQVSAADAQRGEALYQNHCMTCHTSQAHIREKRKADSPEALREWVARWQRSESLGWADSDIEDVAAFLDARYYKFESTTKR